MSQTCVIRDCSNKVIARGWCPKHYYRWSVHGDPEWCPPPADKTGYHYIHKRLNQVRGPASEYPCEKCGEPAAHWAWTHEGPNRAGTVSGRAIKWGTDESTYIALCRRCHAILDGGGSYSTYSCGHLRDYRKDCRTCRNARQQRSRALKKKALNK